MAYPMTGEGRAMQGKARRFVDEELIPYEVEAEMNGGQLPQEVIERQQAKLKELGLWSINMPKDLGGAELTTFQQVLVSEQIGRVTNGLGWVLDGGGGITSWGGPQGSGLVNNCPVGRGVATLPGRRDVSSVLPRVRGRPNGPKETCWSCRGSE
jgi:hypothetical protein